MVEKLITTQGKSPHLLIGSVSAQGNDTQCQSYDAEDAGACEE